MNNKTIVLDLASPKAFIEMHASLLGGGRVRRNHLLKTTTARLVNEYLLLQWQLARSKSLPVGGLSGWWRRLKESAAIQSKIERLVSNISTWIESTLWFYSGRQGEVSVRG